MDPLKIYNYFYQKAHTVAKQMVIDKMKSEKKKQRPFSKVHEDICNYLFDYNNTKYTEPINKVYYESFSLFQKRHSYYEGESDDVIVEILKNEVRETFGKNHKTSYSRFIADLAIHSSLKEAHRHYSSYRDYYVLIYELNMYKKFFFEDFKEMEYTSSFHYKDMMDIKYPYRTKRYEEYVEEERLKETNIKAAKIKEAKLTKNESSTLLFINDFTDDERFLLINIFFSLRSSNEISLVDYIKILRIVGGFEDLEIFHTESNRVTTYAKIHKGIKYYSGRRKLHLVESTIRKLEPLKMDVFQSRLTRMRTIEIQNLENSQK